MIKIYRTIGLLQIILAIICGSGAYALYDMARENIYNEAYTEGQTALIMSLPIEALGEIKVHRDKI